MAHDPRRRRHSQRRTEGEQIRTMSDPKKYDLGEERIPKRCTTSRGSPDGAAAGATALRAPGSRSVEDDLAPVSDGGHHAGSPRALRSRFPSRCATSTSCGARRPDPRRAAGVGARYRPRSSSRLKGVSPSGLQKSEHPRWRGVYNRRKASLRMTTRTGAASGDLRFALRRQLFGLGSRFYMGKVIYEQNRTAARDGDLRRSKVHSPPHELTEYGRATWRRIPNSTARSLRDLEPSISPLAARRHQVFAGLRAQPRHAAPDRYRP